ncbi:unnamed protein product [Rangifer tarandus platyrhynchus]|uniref:Uncharacterized protein n=1 Tax=Rangifer tarandus platyrhynchus TaxID=3082113 RepID=A0AC59Y5T5_RANTA
MGLIPGSGLSPGGGNGNPFQEFCLKNPIDRGTRWTTVHGVTKSQTRLSTHAGTFQFDVVPLLILLLCDIKKIIAKTDAKKFFSILSSKIFTVWGLRVKSLTHFRLTFVYGVR